MRWGAMVLTELTKSRTGRYRLRVDAYAEAEPHRLTVRGLESLLGLAALAALCGAASQVLGGSGEEPGSAFQLARAIKDIAPAALLFAAGAAFGLQSEELEQSGLGGADKFNFFARRLGILALFAVAFEAIRWLAAPPGASWHAIVSGGLLHCMTLGTALLAPLCLLDHVRLIRWCLLAGVAFAGLAPVISSIAGESVPWPLLDAVASAKGRFAIFPYASYIAFGAATGAMASPLSAEQVANLSALLGTGGLALTMTAAYFQQLPYSLYDRVEFHLDSPALVFMRLGVLLTALAIATAVIRRREKPGLLERLGRRSLLLYCAQAVLLRG
jgi:hypothetical protein